MSAHSALFEQSQSLLMSNAVRPEPQYIGHLIMAGLTEDILHDAWSSLGNPEPVMDLSLRDLDTLLPYIHKANDHIATVVRPQDVLLSAARDGEAFYDDYQITHDADPTSMHLIPASSGLWNSGSMDNKDLSRKFFTRYGLSQEPVLDPDVNIYLLDSGFFGTVGRKFDVDLQYVYGVTSLLESGRLILKFASAKPNGRGTTILEVDPVPDPPSTLPKASQFVDQNEYYRYGPSYMLGVALQLMPRYHGHFVGIEANGDHVVATTEEAMIDTDVDSPKKNTLLPANTSYVNPLAAAVTQYRIVRSALNRAGTA